MMLRDVKLAGRHAMRRVSQSPGLFFLFSLLCVVCCCGALSACVHLIIEPLEGFPYMHDDTLEVSEVAVPPLLLLLPDSC